MSKSKKTSWGIIYFVMKIFLLANNWVGLEIAKYLKKRKEKIIALGIAPVEKQKFTKEIIKTVNLPKGLIFDGSSLRDPTVVKKIKELAPDIIIGAFWVTILKPEIITIPPYGCINFHPGYLPYNRGLNPNVWPIVEDTPAGVTLHYIDSGIDTGDIISRRIVEINAFDTAETVYNKTLVEMVNLFNEQWPLIKKGRNAIIPQSKFDDKPTFHLAKDLEKLDKIDLDKKYTGRELINILRSRSYKNRFFSYYLDRGKKVFIRVELSDKDT